MKTMIWKEWRENLKWAVLAMLALGLAEFHGLPSREATAPGGWAQPEYTLTARGFQMMSLFGCAVAGLLLGLLQFIPETARDRWAGLLHRPGGKRDVFFGKTMAGIALYLAVTGIAFAGCASYVAFPGHYAAPFLPEMLLPGLVDIGAGVSCYLVGVIIGLDRGRWGGLRLAAGGCGLTVFLITGSFFSLWPDVIVEVAAAVILLATAWGSMEAPSRFGRRSLAGRAGALAVCLVAASGLGLVLPGMWFPMLFGYGSAWDYVISEDGVPLVVETRQDVKTVTDVEGHPVSDPRYTVEEIHRFICILLREAAGQYGS
jgi:hypothetical protein